MRYRLHTVNTTCILFLSMVHIMLTLLSHLNDSPTIVPLAHHDNYLLDGMSKLQRTYGHIHVAKTAGTTLNGYLAAHFERVCGHKGYSFDAFKAIQRFDRNNETFVSDFYTSRWPGFNRQRVPHKIMDEIGYEDCDWISQERPVDFWAQFKSWPLPLELHLPCRDPVDHLMSQCNHKNITFNCTGGIEAQIKTCVIEMNRFSTSLSNTGNVDLRCYEYNQTFPFYIRYMESRLQRKKIESKHIFWQTNKKRIRERECIWGNAHLRSTVHTFLVSNYDYYRFCEQCVNSDKQLKFI